MGFHERLADLPLHVEAYGLEGLSRRVSDTFERLSTVVRLTGGGEEGVGEDVTYEATDQRLLQQAGAQLPLAGRYDLRSFSERLDELELFPRPPQRETSRSYRRWAFESAALDLALRQAAVGLAGALGIEPSPVRFVVSMGLGKPPDVGRLHRWLELYPAMRFKLDASSAWDDRVVAELAALDAIDVVDLKGAYHGTPVDLDPDPVLYSRVARGFPRAWLEDPALTAETGTALAGDLDRLTWDAPIHSVDDILALERRPRTLNLKPSRFGSLRRLMEAYDFCSDQGIAAYGGGQFELGPGRGQIQYLASLFHPDAPNDVAPGGYNSPTPVAGLEPSPLAPRVSSTGFRRV